MIETFIPKGQFCGAIMPMWLLKRKKLSLGAKVLYSLMASCANERDFCWPSQGWLAETMDTSIRSVQKYIKELEELMLIRIDRIREGSSLRYYFLKSDVVELRFEQVETQKIADSKGYANIAEGTLSTPANSASTYATLAGGYANSADVYNKVLNKDKEEEKIAPLPAFENTPADKAFSQLWEIWPQKVFCDKALGTWRKLWASGQLPPIQELLQKVEFLKNNDSLWRKGFAPILSFWLRSFAWDSGNFFVETPELNLTRNSVILACLPKNHTQYGIATA